MTSTQLKREIIIVTTSILSSANALNLTGLKFCCWIKSYSKKWYLDDSLPDDKNLDWLKSTLSQMANFRLLQTESVGRRQFKIYEIDIVPQKYKKHCGKRRNCL